MCIPLLSSFASLAQLAKAPSLFVFSVSGLKARELATPSFPSDCVAREGGTPRERGFANRLVFSILYENVTGRTGLALHCPLVPRSFVRSFLPSFHSSLKRLLSPFKALAAALRRHLGVSERASAAIPLQFMSFGGESVVVSGVQSVRLDRVKAWLGE